MQAVRPRAADEEEVMMNDISMQLMCNNDLRHYRAIQYKLAKLMMRRLAEGKNNLLDDGMIFNVV